MSDMAEVFREMARDRKDRHADWKEQNLKIINESGITFTDKGEALLFRGQVNADFYPSTGRWRSNGKTYRGGAKSFISWLNNQAKLRR